MPFDIESIRTKIGEQSYQGLRQHLHRLEAGQQLALAMHGHAFKRPADVHAILMGRVDFDGEEARLRGDEGRAVPLGDGIAAFAKAFPMYLGAGPHCGAQQQGAAPKREDFPGDEPGYYRAAAAFNRT